MSRYTGVSMLAIATALAFGGQALAQDDDATMLDELVVTAQKREERLIDAPQTINVVTGDQLEKLNLTQFEDVAKLAPGLDITVGDGRQQGVSLRGVKFDNDTGTTRTVDLYLNEVPADPVQTLQAQYDIGQIQVLRGPQGTLRGGTGPSGAILIGTRKPDLDGISGTVSGSYTDLRSRNIQGGIGAPIIEGKLAVRIAALYDYNYGNNVFGVESGLNDFSRTRSVRGSVRWTPIEPLNIELVHQDLRNESRQLRAVVGSGAFGTFGPEDRVNVADGGNDFDIDGKVTTLNATYDFEGSRLSYVGGRQDNSIVFERDLDLGNALFFGLPIQAYQQFDIGTKQDTHEVRFERTGERFWLYRFGYYQSDVETLFTGVVDYTGGNGACGGPLAAFNFPCIPFGGTVPAKTESRGYFTTQTFNFTENDVLDVGVRYSTNKTIPAAGAPTKYDATTGTLSYKHRFDENLMVYGTYGRGFRPGGGDNGGGNTGNLPASLFNYEAEESDSYELGAKASLFDDRIQVAASIYHQDFSNYIARVNNLACTGGPNSGQGPVIGENTVYATSDGLAPTGANACNNTGSVNLTYNADAISRGIEIDVRARLTPGWDAQVTWSYADAHYDDAEIPCNDFDGDGTPNSDGPQAVQAGRNVSLCRTSGALSTLPKWQMSANSEYSREIGQDTLAFIRGIATYRVGTTDPNTGQEFPSAFRVDLFGGVRLDQFNAEIALFARNLLDKTEAVSGEGISSILDGSPTGYSLVSLERGREVGVSVRYSFD